MIEAVRVPERDKGNSVGSIPTNMSKELSDAESVERNADIRPFQGRNGFISSYRRDSPDAITSVPFRDAGKRISQEADQ